MKVEYSRHGQITTLSVAKAFLEEGYCILVKRENRFTSSWSNHNGDDRIFSTIEEAENAILDYVQTSLRVKWIDSYTVY